MSYSLKGLIICTLVVFICVFIESGNFQNQPLKSNLSEVSRMVIPDTNFESSYNSLNSTKNTFNLKELPKKFSSSNISFEKPGDNDHEVRKPPVVSKEFSEFVLEGGGTVIPSHNSSLKTQDHGMDEKFHNKGSKGRKGVKFPGSSVVPRKGVSVAVDGTNKLGDLLVTNVSNVETFINKSLAINETKTVIDGIISHSTYNNSTKPHTNVTMQETLVVLNTSHSKKPEYVSDEKDADDFDKYSIIKTSTTGEDYVIIGIVIVIGIWFSVFGALIFYRRAGEYWDRRHYRRMDFLVEGMYND